MAAHSIQVEAEGQKEKAAPFGLILQELSLPLTLRPTGVLDDRQLAVFCEANEEFEVESDADGSITVMSPAFPQTSRLNQILSAELTLWARQNGGAVFGPDLGIRFPDRTMRGPDCAWLSPAKWEVFAGAKRSSFLPFCPEFIVELRSDTDRASTAEAKLEFWMSRGAELGWLIDPLRKLAMVYRPGQEPRTLLQPDWVEGEGPIAGFRLRMDDFWE